jgi:hypothetical protein
MSGGRTPASETQRDVLGGIAAECGLLDEI